MNEETTMTTRKRILTGDRPTGKLHLGHYVGSHRNRLKFQDEYECFFLIADLHMLTTKPDKESILQISDNARAIVMDHLAIGIDPEKVTFYLQSAVHEIYELQLLLSSLVTVERLQQLPTIKDMAAAAGLEQIPYNLLGYPVLQSADILMPRAHLVPVGKDNESHVELSRQIARRFNNAYGEVFPLPDAYVLGGTLVGTDGQAKMSKSLNNAIFLSDDAASCPQACHEHVHRPQPHPRRRAGHGGGQPGLRLSRRVQPEPGGGGGDEGALPRPGRSATSR